MPYINSKTTLPITPEKEDSLKTRLGQAISILNKPESFLMLGFEDNCDLYMAGQKLEKGAYVEVKLYGSASAQAYEKMTAQICRIYEEELDIPADRIYITYSGISDWGWNGRNF